MRVLTFVRLMSVIVPFLFNPVSSPADEVSDLKSRITHLETRIEALELDNPADGLNPRCRSKLRNSPYEVSREVGARLKVNQPLLLTQLQAVPYYRHGITEGLRLFAIRPGSFFDLIGLCDSDIVTKVGDKSPRDLTELVSFLTKDERLAPSELPISIIRARTPRILLVRMN